MEYYEWRGLVRLARLLNGYGIYDEEAIKVSFLLYAKSWVA